MSSEPLLLACRRLVRRRPATRSEALAVLEELGGDPLVTVS